MTGTTADRSSRVLTGVLTSVVSRGAAALAPIIAVPVALGALGADQYGAWSAALAVTALAVFADLGLGAGLMTRLAASVEAEDFVTSRQLVSSAYACVLTATGLLVGLLWSTAAFIDWGALLAGDAGRGDRHVQGIALTVFTAFVLNIAASLIVRVQYATQQMGRSNLWQATGTTLGLVGVVSAAHVGVSGAPFVAVAAFIPPLTALINTVTFFRTPLGTAIAPSRSAVSRSAIRGLLGLGLGFVLITTLMAASIAIDTWIVARTTNLTDAAEFSVLLRVFTVVGTLVSILSIPLWPNYAAALRAGDVEWVVRTTKRMLILSPVIVAVASGAMAVAAPHVLPLWLGDSLSVAYAAAWGFVAWNVVQAVAAPLFMVQNAAGVLRPQMVGYSLLLVVVPVKWWVAVEFGYVLLPVVTATGYFLIVIPSAVVGYRAALRSYRAGTVEGARP